MSSLGALPVQHQLVLRIADVDAIGTRIRCARVGAWGGAVWVVAGPFFLLVTSAEAVREVVLVRVSAELALGARTDLLHRQSVSAYS